MSLESATYIADLITTNPDATDQVKQGDDHLRLLKSVLQTSLPGVTRPMYLEQASADLASATTPDLSTVASNYINITGTTTITGFATEPAGFRRRLRFASALQLTHNGTSFILPGDANITTVAGDHMDVVSLGSGNWRVEAYYRHSPIDLFTGFTALTAPALDDKLVISDTSASAALKSITPLALLTIINLLTEETAPDVDNDLVVLFDASDTANPKKLKLKNLKIPKVMTVQRLTSGSGTYTLTSTLVRWVRVRMVAGGGGGGASQTNAGSTGGATSFESWTAQPGTGGAANNSFPGRGGTGGVDGTGTLLMRGNGSDGQPRIASVSSGGGGASVLSGGANGRNSTGAGANAPANSGGGGAGGYQSGVAEVSGGGGGEYVEFIMTAAQIGAGVSYGVGVGGAGGAAGTQAGGNGGSGLIIVEEHY